MAIGITRGVQPHPGWRLLGLKPGATHETSMVSVGAEATGSTLPEARLREAEAATITSGKANIAKLKMGPHPYV